MAGARGPGAVPGGPPGADGYNQYPADPIKGIDPTAEISRINGNIMFFNLAVAAGAVGIGLTMCLFVRSALAPPKGFHGGDSDGDMDSDDEDDDDEDDDESDD